MHLLDIFWSLCRMIGDISYKYFSKYRWEVKITIPVNIIPQIIYDNIQRVRCFWFLLKSIDRFSLHKLLQQETREIYLLKCFYLKQYQLNWVPWRWQTKSRDWLGISFTKRIKRSSYSMFISSLTQIQRIWTSF